MTCLKEIIISEINIILLYAQVINDLRQDRGWATPQEFGHFNFPEDNFPI